MITRGPLRARAGGKGDSDDTGAWAAAAVRGSAHHGGHGGHGGYRNRRKAVEAQRKDGAFVTNAVEAQGKGGVLVRQSLRTIGAIDHLAEHRVCGGAAEEQSSAGQFESRHKKDDASPVHCACMSSPWSGGGGGANNNSNNNNDNGRSSPRAVEVVEKFVVDGVDEELRAAGVGSPGLCTAPER